MFETFNNLLADKLDYILAWMLYLPRDLVLVMLAVLTSAMLTFVRIFCTDQKWLGRAEADRIRLNELIAEAKEKYQASIAGVTDRAALRAAKKKYKEDRARYKGTQTQIKMKASVFEIKPLLYSLIPVALLATWAFSRVAYQPPKPGQDIDVRLIVPPSEIGKVAYLTPQENMEADGGWIHKIVLDKPEDPQGWWDVGAAEFRAFMRSTYNVVTKPLRPGDTATTQPAIKRFLPELGAATQPEYKPRGAAVWRVKTTNISDATHKLIIHFNNQEYEADLRSGGRYYAEPVKRFDSPSVQAIEVGMTETRLFGMVGSIDWLYLSPWIVAYLLVAIPFVTILKRTFKIY